MKASNAATLLVWMVIFLPVAAYAAGHSPVDSINWIALFFALTTFYSEGLAAIPAIKANAIYQQVGQVLNLLAKILRSI